MWGQQQDTENDVSESVISLTTMSTGRHSQDKSMSCAEQTLHATPDAAQADRVATPCSEARNFSARRF